MKVALAVLCLAASGAVHAVQPWPREMADSVEAHCVAMVESSSQQPAAIEAKAKENCSCLVRSLQGVVSIEDFQKVVNLPPDQVQQSPVSQAVATAFTRCTQ